MTDRIINIRVRVPDGALIDSVITSNKDGTKSMICEMISAVIELPKPAPQPLFRFEIGKWYAQRGADGAVRVISVSGTVIIGRDIHGDVRLYNLDGEYLRDGEKRDPSIQRYDLIPIPRPEPVLPGPTPEQFAEVLSIVKGLTNEVAQLWRLINP